MEKFGHNPENEKPEVGIFREEIQSLINEEKDKKGKAEDHKRWLLPINVEELSEADMEFYKVYKGMIKAEQEGNLKEKEDAWAAYEEVYSSYRVGNNNSRLCFFQYITDRATYLLVKWQIKK